MLLRLSLDALDRVELLAMVGLLCRHERGLHSVAPAVATAAGCEIASELARRRGGPPLALAAPRAALRAEELAAAWRWCTIWAAHAEGSPVLGAIARTLAELRDGLGGHLVERCTEDELFLSLWDGLPFDADDARSVYRAALAEWRRWREARIGAQIS